MKNLNRRSFFKAITAAASVLPFTGFLNIVGAEEKKCSAQPTGLPEGKKFVTADDKAAQRLDYVAVASESKNAKYKAGDQCGGCRFYKSANAAGDWAPCNMLANKYVSSCGWCKSFKAVAAK